MSLANQEKRNCSKNYTKVNNFFSPWKTNSIQWIHGRSVPWNGQESSWEGREFRRPDERERLHIGKSGSWRRSNEERIGGWGVWEGFWIWFCAQRVWSQDRSQVKGTAQRARARRLRIHTPKTVPFHLSLMIFPDPTLDILDIKYSCKIMIPSK